jgi:hypothetical protein
MSDINGGNLVFKAVFDDGELQKSFDRAKKDIEAMAAKFASGGGTIDDLFKDINESLTEQKVFV